MNAIIHDVDGFIIGLCRVHELERERASRVFNKRNEFRTDSLALEECDTELSEHRKVESKWIIERV